MRTAVVTGATGGIGAATVDRLARDGYDVVAVDRVPSEVTVGRFVEADLSGIDASLRAIRAAVTRVDALVNAAGIVERTRLGDHSAAEWERVHAVNARAPLLLTQGLLDLMERGASVVNVASIEASGVFASTDQPTTIYASSKAALVSITQTLAAALGPRGIRVNAVAPGLIRTPMSAGIEAGVGEWCRSHIALGRWGEPADVADVISFLAGDDSRYVTGTTLVVDGGMSLGLVNRAVRPSPTR